MKTEQEIFDITLFHLRKQGKTAMAVYRGINDIGEIDQPRCAYRGEGGTMCAVGCHIPDELYRPDFEGRAVSDLPILKEIGLFGSTDFLMRLQHLHDKTLDREGLQAWEESMQNLARVLKLNYTPPETTS